jgi:mannose-6-phosphate isomerase-like protein (cupin superfamily)
MDLSDDESTGSYVRDPHLEWVKKEGLPLVTGFAVNLMEVETVAWPRYDARGAILKVDGAGDFLDLWLLDLPAGGSTSPQHHIFEEVIYVISGHGTTSIEGPNGKTHSFEWGPKSFFVIPLNAKYRHFNTSGSDRALLASTTTFPIMINLLHDDAFIFEDEWTFKERFGPDEHFTGVGDAVPIDISKDRRNIWETNFVPDLGSFDQVPENEMRGKGSRSVEFITGDNTMHSHMSEIPIGGYKKAHRHEAGFHIFPVTGQGYSLLWTDDPDKRHRVDWEHGHVYSPPEQWWHQHFNVGQEPSRYLATFLGSNRYPLTLERRANYIHRPDLARGGGQIEPENERPEIYTIFENELTKRGYTPTMARPTYKDQVYAKN